MGNPYLNNDESIILATHNVISRSVRSDVILTNQRLILSDSSHPQFRPRSIPLAVIMTVTKAETATGDPILTLSLATQDGATQPRELVFAQTPPKKRSQECDEWVKKLGELAAAAREEATRTGVSIADLAAAMTAEEISLAAPPDGTPGELPQITPPKKPAAGSCRSLFPKTSSTKVRILAIAAILIVVIAIVAGAYVNSMPHKGSSAGTVAPTTLPTLPPETTPVPAATTQQTPTAAVTTVPTPIPEIPIPTTGVWVRVESPVNYVGSVGTSGRTQAVNATGEHFYQIPAAQTDFLDISVRKQSGYGDPLTIKVYNNGELVKSGTTTAPMGTVELHFSLKTAVSNISSTS
jgi:hypothetical protein